MDRTEAIDILNYDIRQYIKQCEDATDEDFEALNLAIRALEREIEYGQMVADYTKGEALKASDWEYTNTPIDTPTNIPTNTPTNDYISRQQAIDAIEDVDWHHVNSKGELVSGSTSGEESWYKVEDIYEALESLKPITPPGKILVEIKVDTEELVERIKEEY